MRGCGSRCETRTHGVEHPIGMLTRECLLNMDNCVLCLSLVIDISKSLRYLQCRTPYHHTRDGRFVTQADNIHWEGSFSHVKRLIENTIIYRSSLNSRITTVSPNAPKKCNEFILLLFVSPAMLQGYRSRGKSRKCESRFLVLYPELATRSVKKTRDHLWIIASTMLCMNT